VTTNTDAIGSGVVPTSDPGANFNPSSTSAGGGEVILKLVKKPGQKQGDSGQKGAKELNTYVIDMQSFNPSKK